jgi:hypothetical protein
MRVGTIRWEPRIFVSAVSAHGNERVSVVGKPSRAGINRHVIGDGKSPTENEISESILASNLAGGIARCRPKRKKR